MKRSHILLALGAFLGLLSAAPAGAQQMERLDRVVAVVGDSAVLESEVREEMLQWTAAQGQPLPDDPTQIAQLERQIIDGKIEELVILQAALNDSTIRVDERQVETLVQREVTRLETQVGGRLALDRALAQEGLTLPEYRQILARRFRRQGYIEQYIAAVRRDRAAPTVTENEVRDFFRQNRAQFAERPATVTFRQIVIAPSASDSARARARATAQDVLSRVRGGEDFAQVARRFSDDPGTREQGGDLGWFRRGQMVQAFEDAAFGLRPGEISEIVESPFGFHVIKLERARGGERSARHVLIRAAVTPQDIQRAQQLADSVATALRGGAPFDTLADRYADPTEQRRVGPYPVGQLPQPYVQPLTGVTQGDVVGPIRLESQGAPAKFAVVSVMEQRAAGEYDVEDPGFRADLREQLQQQKLIEEVVDELRDRTYVDVRI